MRALLAACLISVIGYMALVALVLDRPLTNGILAAELDASLARAASLTGEKIVILSGSNGPYSHRCEAMEPILSRPCVNGGLAVGVGLDYLFVRWDGLLRAGDIVYLPMEPSQYVRGRMANATGPDAAIMIRHDRATLARLAPERWAGGAFSYDLRGVAMALIEMTLRAGGFRDPRVAGGESRNAWGDRIGHDAARAAANAGAIAAMRTVRPDAMHITAGHGRDLIAAFTRRMGARGVIVIGGLSTGFADAPLDDAAIAAIAATYTDQGAAFVMLANRSRYARENFFDGPEHLHEAAQIAHSRELARAIADYLAGTPRLSVRAGSG